MNIKFWFTNLSEDSGHPWFATHLYAGITANGNPKYNVRIMTASLKFWRIKLLAVLCQLLANGSAQNY